ncbi:ComEA family DNA-binding protein [Sphaerisporangium rufum]|nr:helix-hairpin-helix domain-containing protein [Sphaerisporangium rufum]
MGYAAVKLRSKLLWLATVGYSVGLVAFVAGLSGSGDMYELLGALGISASWVGGTVHSLIIRNRVFESNDSPNDQAIALAQHRRELRQEARELAERDPALARELRIGRPDLPRQYDDGGLVDINHAPAPVIAQLPGLTDELAQRIVQARSEVGAFISAEDVSVALNLPPHLTPGLADLTVYIP